MSNTQEKIYFGKVKKFFKKKGFGFITSVDTGEDYFVHRNTIQTKPETKFRKTLYDFEYVEFTINTPVPDQKHGDPGKLPQVKQVFGPKGNTLRIDDEWTKRQQRDERRKKQSEDKDAPP